MPVRVGEQRPPVAAGLEIRLARAQRQAPRDRSVQPTLEGETAWPPFPAIDRYLRKGLRSARDGAPRSGGAAAPFGFAQGDRRRRTHGPHVWTPLSTPLAATGASVALAAFAVPSASMAASHPAAAHTGTSAAHKAAGTSSYQGSAFGNLDCNGHSPIQHPIKIGGYICAEVHGGTHNGHLADNGYYIGQKYNTYWKPSFLLIQANHILWFRVLLRVLYPLI